MPTFRDDLHLGHSVPMVDTEDIVDGAVTEPKLADNSVSTRTIQDGAVTEPKIAEKAVTEPKLADAAVSTRTIKFRAVTESKIGDSAVSTRTIQNGAVTNPKIANGAVSMNKLDNETQTLIQRGADSSWTPMGDYDIDALYYANDLVFDPETNSSYISLRADNMGHAVTDETWWMKVLDGSYVNRAIEEMEAAIAQAIEDAQEDISELISDSQATINAAVSGANSAAQAANTAAVNAENKIAWVEEQVDSLTAYEVATALDETSIIPVQNKVVTKAFKSVQMPDIEEYSSTLSVPSKTMFRIILPFNFVVGETYNIEVSTANAVSQSVRYYVYQSGQYSNNTNKYLGEIPAGGTTAKTTYTPVSGTNYQFFGFWNNNNAATSVNVIITKKQATNKVVSDTQNIVIPLQIEELFNNCIPNLKVLDYDIYNIENLSIKDCVVDGSNKWYKTAANQGQNAKHIVVPVIDGSIVIMRGKYDVMQFWLNSSYDPNTTYNSGTAAPIVGSRQFISGTDAVLYTPTNAAYFAISIVGGDYTKSLIPDEIIVIKKYVNTSSEKDVPYITTDFEVGCTDASVYRCIKSNTENLYTYFCSSSGSYKFAYIKIPLIIGHRYKLCFKAYAHTKINHDYNGSLYLRKTNPDAQEHWGDYPGCRVVLGKTDQEYFEWSFTAEYAMAYLRSVATDLGNPNFGNANLVVRDIKLIDLGTTDIASVVPILMNNEMSQITNTLANSVIIDVEDTGLYICDRYLNVGCYIDNTGIHAVNI